MKRTYQKPTIEIAKMSFTLLDSYDINVGSVTATSQGLGMETKERDAVEDEESSNASGDWSEGLW